MRCAHSPFTRTCAFPTLTPTSATPTNPPHPSPLPPAHPSPLPPTPPTFTPITPPVPLNPHPSPPTHPCQPQTTRIRRPQEGERGSHTEGPPPATRPTSRHASEAVV